jgi:glycosyltransferase involved in cell wall biosynthesis
MRPLKVLDLRDTYEIGGPGKTILETYRAIDAERFDLHLGVFLTRHETGDTPFVTAARAYGMPVHFIQGFNQFDPRLVARLVDLVKRLRIDILHAHEVPSDVFAYLVRLLHPIPIVTTAHGWFGDGLKPRLYIGLDKRLARSFDRVIAVSSRIRDELLASGVPAAKLSLLHNAIVLQHYRRTGRRGALAEIVGRPVQGPVIACIGRLSPEKGHSDLVDALALLAARGCQVSAVLAGDGPDRPRLEQKIQTSGLQNSVHLVGYVSQPQRILEEADLMVLPSHTEGLPNAALEALTMEVPVLATRVGGTPEVIADGETGRLVEPRAPEALAAAIADFISDPRRWKCMAQEGRAVVEREFNFESRTRRLEAIYSELAAAARPALGATAR